LFPRSPYLAVVRIGFSLAEPPLISLKEGPTSIIDRKSEVEPEDLGCCGYREPKRPFRFPKPIWRAEPELILQVDRTTDTVVAAVQIAQPAEPFDDQSQQEDQPHHE